MDAVKKTDLNKVKQLLYDGADPNIVDLDGKSALHHANDGSEENPEITKLLISYGANVNLNAILNKTPLHYAASKGFKENSKILIIH